MPGIIESLSTLNSIVRTALALVAVGILGTAGYYGYRIFNANDLALKEKDEQLANVRGELAEAELTVKRQDEQISVMAVEIKEKDATIEKLDTSLRLLKVNHRVAWLTVLDQGVDESTDEMYTIVQFVEVNDKGEAIDKPKQFRIEGDVVYIDNWVVKFDDKYVEQADIDRSTSLVLFRRIFSESQSPNDGFQLDTIGARPRAYGNGNHMSDFERKIWSEFWTIANDETKASAMGIRAAHGEAPSMKLQKGKSYRVQLRASDGLSIIPDSGPPPVAKPAA